MSNSSDDRSPVELLAEDFLERRNRGERPTIGEYCDRHPELAQRIRDVFEALILAEELTSGPKEGSGFSSSAVRIDGRRADRMGDYRILREIGRGGMGVVYEAEQEALGRRVALKVLPGNLAGDAQARQRFQREARAAARMHHTNIVPVFDVGQDGGNIYYAMQMIHGQGLDLVIDGLRRLRDQSPGATADDNGGPEQNIAVSFMRGQFEQENLAASETTVEAGATSGSHHETATFQMGTPPSAVLPGQSSLSSTRGNRRVYYRGVAQIGLQAASALAYAHARGVVHRDIKPSNLLLDAAGVVWVTDFGLAKTGDPAMTHTGDILGTIRYMSPERFRGQCDVRADIYSLGLTLYELLALKPAFASPDRLKLIEQIRQVDPASPRSLDSRLPRDLETIVLKAIDKDPRRRYQSAEEMAEDLQRFVADEPIRARRISPGERLVRWGRRNPAVAGLAGAVFLVLIAGMVVSTWQLARARRAESAALASVAAEKAANAAAQAREAETRSVLEFVENKVFAAARPRGQAGGVAYDVTLRKAMESALPFVGKSFPNQPLIEARLRQTMGTSFLLLGDSRNAAEQFEAARALYSRYRGADHPATLTSMSSLAASYQALGRLTDALKLREDTLALRKAKLGPEHPDTLTSMNNLAASYQALGRLADAMKLREQTLALRKAKLGPDHPDTLVSRSSLAGSYDSLARFTDALALRQETLALQKSKLGPDHPDTLLTMSNLAVSYHYLGRLDDALKVLVETLALMKTNLGPDHPDTLSTMNNLANGYDESGQHDKALALRRETLALKKAKLGPDHPDTLLTAHNLGFSYYTLGRYPEALRIYEDTLALQTAKLGRDHPSTLICMNSLAYCYTALGRHAEALKLREETLALQKAKRGLNHPETLGSMNNLASSYSVMGRHGEALKLNQELLAIREAKFGPDHPETLGSRMNVASNLVQLGRAADAAAICLQTVEKWEKPNRTDAGSLYTAACFRAVAAAVLRSADKSPAGATQASAQADMAMAWLKQAVAAGYKNAANIASDHDLDALRDRSDFKKLAAELDAGAGKKN